ncbi:MAG TPA: hemolysin D [Thermoanaerobaculia bacterium]|nr:hemolysin D [Thermoanaerobaculia bacterium]
MRYGRVVILVVSCLLVALTAFSFTQSGLGVGVGYVFPMGHEFVTQLAGLEVIDRLPWAPDDPRSKWEGPQGKAKNPVISDADRARVTAYLNNESRYNSKYAVVFDAILGQRWVDAGGFNIGKSTIIHANDCWDAVAQQAPEIQYDHYMRRYDDRGAEGGVTAMTESQRRFRRYFVYAATSPAGRMIIWDGGGYAAQYEVDRNYFLFGRAVHLFEDSFSPEHTVRIEADRLEKVRQVKAYICSSGAEQHSHKKPTSVDYSNRDVIWASPVGPYKPSNLRLAALVATEATKDLWAAFIRTMGLPPEARRQAAESEADTLIRNWLSGDPAELRTWYDNEANRDGTYVLAEGQTGKGVTVAACMDTIDKKWKGDQMAAVRALAATQRVCLFNIQAVAGYSDLFDPSMHMHYNWEWRTTLPNDWLTPDPGYKIPDRQEPDTGVRYVFKSRASGNYVIPKDGLKDGSQLLASTGAPLNVTAVGDSGKTYFRATLAPWNFVSYNGDFSGDLKLYAGKYVGGVWLQRPTQDAEFAIRPAGDASGIFNFKHSQWVWLYNDRLQLNRHGDPKNQNAQWVFERLP